MAVIALRNIQGMSETPEPSTRPTSVAAAPPQPPAPPAPPRAKPPVLYAVAAWVVIVAGIMFILSVIFFSGALIFGHPCHRYHHGMYRPGDQWGPGTGYGPWQPGYPGYPGGPGGPNAGPTGPGGPSQLPTSVSPTPSSPSPRP